MGTANFTIGEYGKFGGNIGRGNIQSTKIRTSGAHTTTTSASFLEASAVDVIARAGEIVRITASEDMWVAFGGTAATVGAEHFVGAGDTLILEVFADGKISAIDVA
jgi:hypothetical protein